MQTRLRRVIPFFSLFFFFLSGLPAEQKNPDEIVYFYTHCPKCREIETRILPRIPKTHKIIWAYAGNPKVMEELLALGNGKTIFPPALYWNGRLYNSGESLNRFLWDLNTPSPSQNPETGRGKKSPENLLNSTAMKNSAVFCAGLLDGINPCAFTVFLFFLSFLSVSGASPFFRNLAGLAFIASIFCTYFLTGLSGFCFLAEALSPGMLSIFYDGVLILTVFLFFLSVPDLLNLKNKPSSFLLRMPEAWTQKTHALIRHFMPRSRFTFFILTGISVFLGALLGLMELFCTGQIYLPVLKIILREEGGTEWLKAAYSLLIYNAAFILPLLLLLGFFHFMEKQKVVKAAGKLHLLFRILLPLLLLVLIALQMKSL